MTEQPENSKSGTRCNRAGCPILTHHEPDQRGLVYCSRLCNLVAAAIEEADRVNTAVGATDLGSRWAAALAAASDGWSEALRLGQAVQDAALSVGISPSAWHEIRLGAVRRTRRSPRR